MADAMIKASRGILILLDLSVPFSFSPINLISHDVHTKSLLKSK